MLIIAPGRRHNRDIFSIFFNMKVYCVFSLESPHRSDSRVHTVYHFSNKKKFTPDYLNLQLWDFFLGTQERVRNSRGIFVNELSVFEPLKFYCMWHTHSLVPSEPGKQSITWSSSRSFKQTPIMYFW